MHDDEQVKVALALKKDTVLNSGWTIKCENDEIKEFVENNLNEIGLNDSLEPGWDDDLRDFLSSYGYGFSLSEPVFNSPQKTKSGKWELRTIKVRPPHSFIFDLDEKGTVKNIKQFTSNLGIMEFKPEIFMHHVYQPEFGNPYGKSDLKAAHPAWKAKKFLFKMSMRYAERFAGALTVGRYTPNMSSDEVSSLFNVLKTIQDNTTLVIPEEAKVELVQTSKDSSDFYEKLLNMLNMWIARAVLVPDLMGVSGSKTDGGSLALGKEQFKVFLSSIKNDRISLQRKISLKIVQPLVLANFGDKYECKFEFKPLETGDEVELMRLWLDAINGKTFKPNEDEINLLRRKTGFPEGPVEIPAEQVQFDPEGNPIDPRNPGMPGKAKAKEPEKKEEKPTEKKKEFLLTFRDTNAYEAKMDFVAIKRVLESSDESLGKSLESLTLRMAKDLAEQTKSISKGFKPERINELKPKFQKEMNDLVRGHFLRLFKSGLDHAKSEIHGKAKKFTDEELTPEDYEEIIRAESFKLVGDISKDVLKRAQNSIMDGLKSGASQAEIVSRIIEDVGDHSIHNVHTIVRTRTTEVFNAARKTYFDNDPTAKEIITGYTFSAVMDERTSEVCAEMDEKFMDIEDAAYIARLTPPLHFNCRSMLVPVTRFEEQPEKDMLPTEDWLKAHGGNLIFRRNSES